MRDYGETIEDYDKGVGWHAQKSLSYDWRSQIDRFVAGLHGKRVLDAGCGCGRDIAEFTKRGFQADGIDYSGETIRRCRDKFPKSTFYEGDLRAMKEIPDDKYDGVWACASLLNLAKDEAPKALSEFKRVLKRDGILFISVKEGEGEQIIPDQAGKRFFSFYSAHELKALVEKAGFKTTYAEVVPDSDLTGKVAVPHKTNWICLYTTKP